MYYDNEGNIHVEKSDQCYTCEFFNSTRNMCPLLEALVVGAVEFEEELAVNNCSWYKKKVRHLKVIKTDENPEVKNL